jgi:hypothetical protein
MRRPIYAYLPLLLLALACLYIQLLGAALQPQRHLRLAEDIAIVPYDAAAYPQLEVLEGRILAETKPGLSSAERSELWRDYRLNLTFEWINEATGFTYHELDVAAAPLATRLWALASGQPVPTRALRPIVEELGEDPRINWAAPDALLLEWCEAAASAAPALPSGEVAMLIDQQYGLLKKGLPEWEATDAAKRQAPLPVFEYYRLCDPQGTPVDWAAPLPGSASFMDGNARLFGNGQAASYRDYTAAGSPKLAPITICVADTGIFANHPDLRGRLHSDSIDANYRNFLRIGADRRAGNTLELLDREDERATGLPREAIEGRPAGHGTSVAGLLQRCTMDYEAGNPGIRLLPVSVKSAKSFTMTGYKVKSPISAFIKLVNLLHDEYPVTGDASSWGPDGQGELRVVSVSASVPKVHFSEAEWKVVANVVGKASGSIYEDVSQNDRVYVFAAGNEAQGEANSPGAEDYVLSVSAGMPADPALPWLSPVSSEGSNLAANCVSAPGYGLITSRIYTHPNLKYLPEEEIRPARKNLTVPPREFSWEQHTNLFGATSGATPQVSALAALLYAQDPTRRYADVIDTIKASTGGRKLTGSYGESMGLIDYSAALDWSQTRSATAVDLGNGMPGQQ